MSTEKPFKISIPDSEIEFLQQKLSLVRFPDELQDLEGDKWQYGAPLKDIKRLVARWQGGYDWRLYEEDINANVPMFTRDIEIKGEGTLNVHYVHKKSENKSAVPLLFVHGCKLWFGFGNVIRRSAHLESFQGRAISWRAEGLFPH